MPPANVVLQIVMLKITCQREIDVKNYMFY